MPHSIRETLEREITDLPTLSSVVERVLAITANPASSIADLERVIVLDVSLSGRLLRAANSGLYALPQRIASVKHAATILGFRIVRALALSTSIVDALRAGTGTISFKQFRLHALATAIAARAIAQRGRLYEPEEAFTVGLLHDIGKVMLSRVDEEAYRGILTAATDVSELPALEQKRFGVDHAEVGALVLEHWRLPDDLVAGVRNHHVGKSSVVAIIREADRAAHAAGYSGTVPSPPVSGEADSFLVDEIFRVMEQEEDLLP